MGELLFPGAIESSRLTYNTSDPDPSNHTVVYDVTGLYNAQQLAIYNVCIGDPFEDLQQAAPTFRMTLSRRMLAALLSRC